METMTLAYTWSNWETVPPVFSYLEAAFPLENVADHRGFAATQA